MHRWEGLNQREVLEARESFGSNELVLHHTSLWRVFFRQLQNPLLLILFVTTLVSYLFDDRINAAIIGMIIIASVALGFFNEYSSEKTVSGLLKHISLSAGVIRAGNKQDIPVGEVVMGDVVLLHQGSVVPADLEVIEADDLQIDESALTGESLAVHKDTTNNTSVQMGTLVASGSGIGRVVAVGKNTQYGKVSQEVSKRRAPSAFQKGLTQLGSLMTRVIVGMAVAIAVLNIALRPGHPLQAILFALAIAIGLTPALLPVIVTVCMAQGARRMGKRQVVVKELASIEDLGNMQVLCTDKTGTLTEGRISMLDHVNMRKEEDDYVLEVALICNTAIVQHKVIGNPMDTAIWDYAIANRIKPNFKFEKVAESEFNYEARGQYTVIQREEETLMIFKGAPDSVLERCISFRDETGQLVVIDGRREELAERMRLLNEDGLRLIAVAQGTVEGKEKYGFEDVKNLELLGYLSFLDVPKQSAKHALETLQNLGVQVKIVTGDNEIVTKRICQHVGIELKGVLTGAGMAQLSKQELIQIVKETSIFARVSPDQKRQIVQALKDAGLTVGYMGDGVNDAAALHAADVGISVNSAVDVAKDIASVVLLEKGLDVLAYGVKEGRRIFANTIKYILMGTSSNFGNMFSVAGASFFFPFLPMTPSQILLNNSLYDISQLGIPSDEVDEESLIAPHHWDVKMIYRYMLFFGPISSFFDYASFAILWFGFHAREWQFQTGWFLVSILTQVLVVFVIRTKRRPFFTSQPGDLLLLLCIFVFTVAYGLPYMPFAPYLHLSPLPVSLLASLIALAVIYIITVEFVKSRFVERTISLRKEPPPLPS